MQSTEMKKIKAEQDEVIPKNIRGKLLFSFIFIRSNWINFNALV